MTSRWDDIHLFLTVAREGTLTRAAGVLDVHASTLHRRLAELEAHLGATLFLKHRTGYRLTEVGEALVSHAERAEDAVHTWTRQASGTDRDLRGRVRLTVVTSLLPHLAPCLEGFTVAHPHVHVAVDASSRVADLGTETDIAIRPSQHPPEAAVGRKMGRVLWAIYAHAEARPEAPWVVYEGMDHLLPVRWRKREFGDVRACMSARRVMDMTLLLPRVHGQGMLPCYVGDHTPGLVRRSEPIADTSVDLWMLIHADLRRSARVRALVDHLEPALVALRPHLLGEHTQTP